MITTLLLDRDGVLIQRRGHAYTPADMVPLPGVVEGLAQLPDMRFFIVSNQSGIGRGHSTHEQVRACNEQLKKVLQGQGITIHDVVYCPHLPEDNCDCRKPKIGMWNDLRDRHHLIPEECVMVGDRGTDIAFGQAIGCQTVLVGPGDAEASPTWHIVDLRELPTVLLSAV